MGYPNENWDRWICASIAEHFNTNVSGLQMHVEGNYRFQPTNQWFEVRVDGPYCEEFTKNEWTLFVQINTLIATSLNETNIYTHRTNTGKVTAAFHSCINVYKYGGVDGVDDGSLVGVLKLEESKDGGVVVSHFGQIHQDVELQQTTVEGHYKMELSKGG